MNSCLYTGFVSHRRTHPAVHAFRYPLAVFHLDLDELPALDRRLRLFAVNRPGVFSFQDSDHMDRETGDTRRKLRAFLRHQGVDLEDGKIFLLTQCRLFHYVFNPVSFYFCYTAQQALHAVVAEVNNTFGERHLYLLSEHNRQPAAKPGRRSYQARKIMHVSPFLSTDAIYDFHFAPVAERLSLRIGESERGERILDSHLWGRRRELSDRRLGAVLLRYPLLTLKITAAIHWQALRLYRKGAPFSSQPDACPAQKQQIELIRELGKEVVR